MGFDLTNMPGRGSLDLQAGAKAIADQSAGGMVPKPPDQNDPQYRMGIGQRILGMANNFLQGMAHRGPVTYTGRGAMNGRYDRDMEAYRNGTLGRPSQKPPTVQPAGNAGQTTQPGFWESTKKAGQSPFAHGNPIVPL